MLMPEHQAKGRQQHERGQDANGSGHWAISWFWKLGCSLY
jgi:hypothetical protein